MWSHKHRRVSAHVVFLVFALVTVLKVVPPHTDALLIGLLPDVFGRDSLTVADFAASVRLRFAAVLPSSAFL